MDAPKVTSFLQMPTQTLLDEFGAGSHKPGSGSAAALLGLLSCKMMQTVIAVTLRNHQYARNYSQVEFVGSTITSRHEPFFRDAVQQDSVLFDLYHRAVLARRACDDPQEKRTLSEQAREKLLPATEIQLQVAQHAIDLVERGLLLYDLGAKHARGDSGVAISAALSSCSGALFIVYLNLLQFREGRWASTTRITADSVAQRYQDLQFEQFRRVSRIQTEGIDTLQPELPLELFPLEEENI